MNWADKIGENIIKEVSLKIGDETKQININKKNFDIQYRHLKKQYYKDINEKVSYVIENYTRHITYNIIWSKIIVETIMEILKFIHQDYITNKYHINNQDEYIEYIVCYENIVIIINNERIEYIFNEKNYKKSDLEELHKTFSFLIITK